MFITIRMLMMMMLCLFVVVDSMWFIYGGINDRILAIKGVFKRKLI